MMDLHYGDCNFCLGTSGSSSIGGEEEGMKNGPHGPTPRPIGDGWDHPGEGRPKGKCPAASAN